MSTDERRRRSGTPRSAAPRAPGHWRTSPRSTPSRSTTSRCGPAASSRRAAACWSPHRPARARRSSASSPCTSPWRQGRKCFYTTPIKALSNQKFNDLVQALRRRQGRPAHRRQQHQRRGAGGRDDHRGAAQHAVRRVADAPRARLRGDGRGALPRRPDARRGLGGGDHPPARVGGGGLPVGDRQQRRGVRRVAGHRARRDHDDRRGAAAGAALPARDRRPADVRPVRPTSTRPPGSARRAPRSTPSWSGWPATTGPAAG